MSEVLKFRRGEAKNLNAITPKTGSIYITTDERAMYVDIPDGEGAKRIRIGNFVEYKTTADLAAAGYYSTEALYLIEDYNGTGTYALLKYKGQGAQGAEFVHLNSTSSVATELATLTGKVNTNTDNIATNAGGIAANATAIEGLGSRLTTAEQGITTITGTTIPALQQEVDNLEGVVAENKTAAESALSTAVNNLQASIDTKATATNVYTKSEADAKFLTETQVQSKIDTSLEVLDNYVTNIAFTAEQERVNTALSSKATTSSVSALQGEVDALETTVNTKLAGIDTTVTDYVDGKASAAQQAATTASNSYTDSEIAKVNGVNAGIAEDVDKLKSDLSALSGKVDTKVDETVYEDKIAVIEENIDGINIAIGALDDTYATDDELAAAIEVVEGTITILDGRVSTAERNIATQGGQISALEEKVTALEAEDEELAQAIEDVRTELNEALAVADAMTFKGVATVEQGALKLPTSDVKGGDTYVVQMPVNDATLGQLYAGDLIIANEDQGTEATYTGGWIKVDTGYIEAHENSLGVANNKVSLLSHIGGELGSVTYAGDYTEEEGGIKVTTSGNTINFEMCWGEF